MVGGEQHSDIESWQEVLGMTTGRRPPGDKETSWWWNIEVKDAIRAKKDRGQEEVGRIRKAGRERHL